MNWPPTSSDDLLRWLAQGAPVALRVGGFLVFGPFLGDRAVSYRVKVGLMIAMTILLVPVVGRPGPTLAVGEWVRIVFAESAVGLLMGLALQSIFEAMQFAGQIAGIQLGLSLATLFDPQSNSESTALPVFVNLIALLIYLQLNVHHWVLRAMGKSFAYLPVGTSVVSELAARQLVHLVGTLFVLGIQIAAPVLLATLLIDVVTSFIAKASPQLPALLISVPVKNLTGYALLLSAVALWPAVLERHFAAALDSVERILRLAKGG
jgi:flagellar biosynthesis protein FliR